MDKKHIPSQSDLEERNEEEGENGEQGRTKRFDLSFAQVMGSAVATVVAAFLAGQLGVYGTFFGAGVVSLVATSGGPIFQHLFRRTGEQIKEVAVPPVRGTKPGARQLPVRDPAEGWKDDSGLDATQAMRGTGQVPAAEPPAHDTQATRLIPSASPPGEGDGASGGAKGGGERSPDQVQMLDTAMVTRMLPGAGGGAGADGGSDDATRVLGAVEGSGNGQVPEEKLPGEGEFTDATVHGTRWRGWKRTLLPAVVVFVIAMGGVTVYEALAGHNVSGGKGVSVTDLFRSGGGSSGDSPDTPHSTPDPGQSEDGGDGSTGGDDGSGGQSSDPGTGDRHGSGDTESGSGDGATDDPDPSTSQRPGGSGEPGGTKDPGNPGSTGDGSDSGDQREDTGDSSGTGKGDGGAGSGQLPQRQPTGPASE